MKKYFIFSLLALLMVSCDSGPLDKPTPDPVTGEAKLKIVVTPNEELGVVTTGGSNASTRASVALKDFGVVIKNAITGENHSSYASYSDIPEELDIPAGEYEIQARNGVLKSAAFEAPYYYGATKMTVAVGETKDVKITCGIANVKVTIAFKPSLLGSLSNVTARVKSQYETDKVGSLSFNSDEKRAGWFAAPYTNEMSVYIEGISNVTGKKVDATLVLSNVKPRQWRQVTADIRTSGGAGIEIEINDDVIVVADDDVLVPDNDDIIDNNGDDGNWEEGGDPKPDPDPEPDDKAAPTITGVSLEGEPFDIDEPVEIVVSEGNVLDVKMVSVHADGIGQLLLNIESEALKEALAMLGITGEVDLANPPTDGSMWVGMFQDPMIGILDPNLPIRGKKEHMFSVGPLMSLLGSLPGAFDGEHKFHIKVVDGNGTVSKTLVIKLIAQ